MLKPNNYGKILSLEGLPKIKIDDLVSQAREVIKKQYLESIELGTGHRIDLVTSGTRFGGVRYWFKCPRCGRRAGVMYQGTNGLLCRICVGYRYRGSRYKGMTEIVQ